MSYIEKMFDLSGKTAIVAGGAGVIGTVLSATLLEAGAGVTIWSRSRQSVDTALEKLSVSDDIARRVFGDCIDTGDEAAVAAGLEKVISRCGSPEILINAVGGNLGKAPLVETDIALFEKVLKLNLTAGLLVPTKVVAAYWIDNQIKGTIINLASMASYNPLSGVWAYDAAKAGVPNLTMGAASEFAPHGIRVNAIAPGFFLGKQNRSLLIDEKTGDYTPRGAAVIHHTPFGRFGEVDELSGVTLFLASSKASGFVTGATIPVDGGYLAYNI